MYIITCIFKYNMQLRVYLNVFHLFVLFYFFSIVSCLGTKPESICIFHSKRSHDYLLVTIKQIHANTYTHAYTDVFAFCVHVCNPYNICMFVSGIIIFQGASTISKVDASIAYLEYKYLSQGPNWAWPLQDFVVCFYG